jgi:hypothetical protein
MANSVDKAAASHVAQLAYDMLRGYLAHIAAVRSIPRIDGNALVRLIAGWPSDFVQSKDGTKWSFDTQDALVDLADKTIDAELPRVWLTGSLLALGDALTEQDYFDHAPLLELVYHLRNGIAHGNRFNLTARGLDRLKKRPAHNRDASSKTMVFEIASALDGQEILFEFMGAGDVLDLLSSVRAHLTDLSRRCGEPLPVLMPRISL